MRAAKPRWHSSGSRSLLPASSWPGKIIRKWVRTLSPSVWSFKGCEQEGNRHTGWWNINIQTVDPRGRGKATCQCQPSPLLLDVLVFRAGSPACLLLLGYSPDAIQVHPTALPLKLTKPQQVSLVSEQGNSCPGLPCQNVRTKKQPSHSLPDPHRKELCLFKPTSLILRKNLWWHRSSMSIKAALGFIPRTTGVYVHSIHFTARKSIAIYIAQSIWWPIVPGSLFFSYCTDKYPIMGNICFTQVFRRSTGTW